MQPLVTKLRNEILPALVPYGIVCVEAAYAGKNIEALQLRDANGMRASRESVPAKLLASLEMSLEGFVPDDEPSGQGVVSVDLTEGVVTRKHQRLDAVAFEESVWPL